MKPVRRKKLPIDVQAFEIMRGEPYVYVDKTRHIARMLDEGRYYFLSRPRRFGKSLFASTLKCLFEGKKDLFEGLWIAEHGEWEWQEHPVVMLDFSHINNETPENLNADTADRLSKLAAQYSIDITSPLLTSQFFELILSLHKHAGMPVVVLIDEYDKPIIDHLGKGDEHLRIAKANRDVLKSFFGVLKSGELAPILRFVFLTGISRFSKVSIFSELNNLIDLSMHTAYPDILGYTQNELERCFHEYIERLAEKFGWSLERTLSTLAHQYDGYRFCREDVSVYNPYSVLHALNEQQLADYWFESATPSFLIHLLKEKQYPLPALEGLEASRTIFAAFELDRLRPEAILFQTGYLTIADVQDRIYTLSYPNLEVKRAFTESLLLALAGDANGGISSLVLKLARYLGQEDLEAFFETMTAIFAGIPYTLNMQYNEAYFHTIFYLMVSASGADADCEPLSSAGRIDLAIEFPDKVYLIEFKCNQSANAALRQIRSKRYAERYQQSDKRVMLLGINFDSEQHTVAEWKTATPDTAENSAV